MFLPWLDENSAMQHSSGGKSSGHDGLLLVGMILFVISYIFMLTDAPTYLIARERPRMVVTSQIVDFSREPSVPFPRPMASVQGLRR